MSKRIWTQSRQIEAQCSTQNKRGNRGRLGVNRGQSGSIGSNQGQFGDNLGQLGTIRRQSGTNWGKLEVILKDKKDKLGKRQEEERKNERKEKCSF